MLSVRRKRPGTVVNLIDASGDRAKTAHFCINLPALILVYFLKILAFPYKLKTGAYNYFAEEVSPAFCC